MIQSYVSINFTFSSIICSLIAYSYRLIADSYVVEGDIGLPDVES